MNYPENLSEKDRYWLNIIQECRASGKSDYQWLQENNIAGPTFYYHVKQLREKTCEIPSRNGSCKNEVQKVVPLLIEDDEGASQTLVEPLQDNTVAVRLTVHGISVEISAGATQQIIQNTLSALRFLC